MNIRAHAAVACLVLAALGTAACGGESPADPSAPADAAQEHTDPRAALEAAFEKSAAETSSRISMTSATLDMAVEVDRTAKTMHTVGTVEFAGTKVETESVFVDGVNYVKDPTSGKWTAYEQSSLADVYFSGSMFDSGQMLSEESTVTATSPNVYEIDAAGSSGTLGALLGAAVGGDSDNADDGPSALTVTVGDDGLVTGIAIKGPTPDKDITIDIELGVTLDIEAPADEDIEKS